MRGHTWVVTLISRQVQSVLKSYAQGQQTPYWNRIALLVQWSFFILGLAVINIGIIRQTAYVDPTIGNWCKGEFNSVDENCDQPLYILDSAGLFHFNRGSHAPVSICRGVLCCHIILNQLKNTNRLLRYGRAYLPLCKVADTPFHIYGDEICIG